MDELAVEQIMLNYQAYVFWASRQIEELEDELESLRQQPLHHQ